MREAFTITEGSTDSMDCQQHDWAQRPRTPLAELAQPHGFFSPPTPQGSHFARPPTLEHSRALALADSR